jgi:dynein heavy chain
VKTWLPSLEKKIEEYSEGAHISYRIFLSAEPAPNPGLNHLIQIILILSRFKSLYPGYINLI